MGEGIASPDSPMILFFMILSILLWSPLDGRVGRRDSQNDEEQNHGRGDDAREPFSLPPTPGFASPWADDFPRLLHLPHRQCS